MDFGHQISQSRETVGTSRSGPDVGRQRGSLAAERACRPWYQPTASVHGLRRHWRSTTRPRPLREKSLHRSHRLSQPPRRLIERRALFTRPYHQGKHNEVRYHPDEQVYQHCSHHWTRASICGSFKPHSICALQLIHSSAFHQRAKQFGVHRQRWLQPSSFGALRTLRRYLECMPRCSRAGRSQSCNRMRPDRISGWRTTDNGRALRDCKTIAIAIASDPVPRPDNPTLQTPLGPIQRRAVPVCSEQQC